MAGFIRGITYKPSDVTSSQDADAMPCMRTKNIQTDLDQVDLVYIPRSLVKTEKILRAGDILVSSANSWNLVGKCSWIPHLSYQATFGGFTSVLRAHDKRVISRYLYHWFSTDRIQQLARSFGQQTTSISNLNHNRCLDLEIPLPPLDEQRRIAAILDKADALRRKRKRALELLDGLTQAIFLDMFGDPTTNPLGFSVASLGELCDVITGNTPPRSDAILYGDAIEWIKSDNINPPERFIGRATEFLSRQGMRKARTAPAGSILVTCIAGSPNSIGNAAMTDRDVAFNQQINALIPRSIDPLFLYAQIRTAKRLIQAASTGGMKGLVSKSRLSAMEVMAPAKQHQERFSKIAARSFGIADKFRNASATDNLFTSLQHRAFTGQL